MLPNLREYHRISPQEPQQAALDHVLALLARKNVHTVPLAGGDSLVGSADPEVEAVVDLQDLGLETVRLKEDGLHIGAMATRTALAEDENAAQLYNGVIARTARLWGGSVQRNRATMGGALAVAAPDDPLIAAMLVADALVVLYARDGYREVPLSDFLPGRAGLLAAPALIVEVKLPVPAPGAGAGLAAVARTPADNPIVLAAAVLRAEGTLCTGARLALGGVAPTTVRLAEVEAMLAGQPISAELIDSAAERLGALIAPAGDYRGSVEYRRAMACVLTQRALHDAWTALTSQSLVLGP
jgi:aerobic carbon-monoxide dehydrogenase medium subunit